MNAPTILIVDDSDIDRKMLSKVLERKGYSCLLASNGKECLEILNSSPVSLVLLDIMMPGMPGIETLVEIRKKFNPIELPVIMITAKSDSADIVECLHSKANDYITKPVNFEVMISRISTQLKISDLSRDMSSLKEIATVNAMITTFNHQINNPLSVALCILARPDWNDPVNAEKIKAALWRISEMVKAVTEMAEKKDIQFAEYTTNQKMIKIK